MEVRRMLAEELDFVIGVDTHADSHTLAFVAAPSGGLLGQQTIATTARGYDQALRIARAQASGRRAWALEGSGCYGAGLARRLRALEREERALKRQIAHRVIELAAWLLAEPGIGPITAAQLLIPWSHRGRLWGESAFARLGGVAPIPASSGKVVRHRLDRGGDRQLNRALHTIIVSRRKRHAPTIAYIARRHGEGKSEREAIRCLKRFLARSLFRKLEAMPT